MNRLLIAILIILNSACSTTAKQVALHDFGVGEPLIHASHQSTNKAEISIDSPAWLATECIHYRLLYASPTQLRCYNLDKWVAPPAELFKQQLLASGKFSNYRLMIQLLAFEQQFDNPKQARVILHFVVDIYALNSEHLIATQHFHLAQSTPSPDAIGAVTGFAHAQQQAIDKLQQWLITIK